MDYLTKPLSRDNIIKMAPLFRETFGISNTGAFPVLEALEKLPDVFGRNYNYEIQEDCNFERNVMARCMLNIYGGYTVEIKESVYNKAYSLKDGPSLGFICHELCHIFLFYIGYTPVYERGFTDGKIPAYKSVEWQAKALCGEVMIPHEESKGMMANEIVNRYHVSKSFAIHRLKHG